MTNLLVNWLLSAVSLIIVAYLIPGFEIRGFGTALVAAIVVALINATIGFILKVITVPITILTLGLFLLVINAIMLKFAAYLVSGFDIDGFFPAFVGAVVIALVSMGLRYLVFR